jgi:MoxR-like ATPase
MARDDSDNDGEPIQSKHITHQPAPRIADLYGAFSVYARLRDRLRAVVRGRDEVIELVIVAVLADGHVLLEDFPGSGKTTLAKALGDSIVDDKPDDNIVSLRRIQFTPDLLPSDVTGTTIFDPNTGRFFFRPGPLFAHIVLADEINRTTPKVQSALLEAMAEKQTTVDNRTRRLDDLFLVIATQNPLDVAGTFPLPNAQLDRFLFKIRMTHVSQEAELEILRDHHAIRANADRDDLPRVTRTEILDARRVIETQIFIHPAIHQALVEIAHATRTHERILQGVSTRSLVLALSALQARALTNQRHYVIAEDIDRLANEIFTHRIEVAPGAGDATSLIKECTVGALERLAAATLGRA